MFYSIDVIDICELCSSLCFLSAFYLIKNTTRHKKYHQCCLLGLILSSIGYHTMEKLYLKYENYIGIDVEDSGHDSDRKIVDRYFDGFSIPFDDNTFDSILCTEVLEHAVDPEILIQEMKRVTKNDGMIFLTVPSMWGEHEIPYDFRRYTSYGIKKMASDHGLEI